MQSSSSKKSAKHKKNAKGKKSPHHPKVKKGKRGEKKGKERKKVELKGFEPLTPALSRRCSKPTELQLRIQNRKRTAALPPPDFYTKIGLLPPASSSCYKLVHLFSTISGLNICLRRAKKHPIKNKQAKKSETNKRGQPKEGAILALFSERYNFLCKKRAAAYFASGVGNGGYAHATTSGSMQGVCTGLQRCAGSYHVIDQ